MSDITTRIQPERDKSSLAWGETQAANLWDKLYARYKPAVESKTVLDFGCSWGYICKYVLDHFKPKRVVGVDIAAMWDTSGNGWDWRKEGDRLAFFEGDVRFIDQLKPNSFDIILCTSVLQYLRPEQLEGSLNKLFSILNPGGEMLLRTRAFTSYIGADFHRIFTPPYVHMLYPKRYIDEYLEKRDGSPPRYLNPLTGSTYLAMFQRAGFELIDVRRRRSGAAAEWAERLKAIYPTVSDNELLCSELEVRMRRPAAS